MVMFSVVCFCHSVCPSVCPQGGPHVTITHDALDLTVQGSTIQAPPPPARHQTWKPMVPGRFPQSDLGPSWPCPLLLTFSGQHWRPVQTRLPTSRATPSGGPEACTVCKRVV